MQILIQQVRQIILTAGYMALDNFNKIKYVEEKPDHSPVSNVDKEIDDFIAQELNKITPHIAVISEEGSHIAATLNKFWLVDPIDGTSSYINSQETYTVNIALIDNNEPKLGFIYIPAEDILYYTDEHNILIIENQGQAYCAVDFSNKNCELIAAISSNPSKKVNQFVQYHNISQVISIPSSIKLCMVADGRADLYPRFGTTMEWDIAAGHALIRAVGGEIFCEDGQILSYGKTDFINPNFIACSKYTLSQKIVFDQNK